MSPQLQTAVSGGADAVGMVGDDVLQLLLPGLHHPQPQAAQVCALNMPGPEHPRLGQSRQGDRWVLRRHEYAGIKAEPALYGGIVKKYMPKVSPNPNVSSNQAGGWPRSSHWPPS